MPPVHIQLASPARTTQHMWWVHPVLCCISRITHHTAQQHATTAHLRRTHPAPATDPTQYHQPVCWSPSSVCAIDVCHLQHARPAAAVAVACTTRTAAATTAAARSVGSCCARCCCASCRRLGPWHCARYVCYAECVAQRLVATHWAAREFNATAAHNTRHIHPLTTGVPL